MNKSTVEKSGAKARELPGGAIVINADREPIASNPHSWLPLLCSPPGEEVRVMYGVLRPTYRGWSNSAEMFAAAKIGVSPKVGADKWEVTAVRADVILPIGADDRYIRPQTLIEAVDAPEIEPKPALLTYVTFTFPTARLHEQFEHVRAVTAEIVGKFQTPALIVQHAPHLARSTNPHHCHVLLIPRRLTSLGFGAFVTPFTGDRGRAIFVDAITARLAAGRAN